MKYKKGIVEGDEDLQFDLKKDNRVLLLYGIDYGVIRRRELKVFGSRPMSRCVATILTIALYIDHSSRRGVG